jgi:hypothetical protein
MAQPAPPSAASRLDADARAALVRDDEPHIGRAFDLTVSARAIQANTRHLALMLRDTELEHRASRAGAFVESLADKMLDCHVPGPIACAKGCSYCCKTFVSATIPEILNLARAVRANRAQVERVHAAAAHCKQVPQHLRETNRITCPMLEDNACAAYAHRPVSCRYLLSTSLPTCIRILQDGKSEPFAFAEHVITIRSFAIIMMKTALTLAGLPAQHLELNQALAAALRHDDSEARWLAGEPVFAGVPVDQADVGDSAVTRMVDYFVALLRPTI